MKKAWNPQGPEYCFHLFCLMILTATVLFSCNGEEELQDMTESIPLYSVNNLASELPQLAVEPAGIFDPSVFIEPYFLEPFSAGQFVAASDRLEKMIHLFDETGTHLTSAGGEGRGPGEFMGAINLHGGRNHDLYVLDIPHHRITRFNVYDDELNYDTTFLANLEQGFWLHNIYVTEWGNFGVIRSIVDYSTGEEAFHLYKLDETFNQVEHLFEMPGNEKMSVGEWSHINHMFGEKTLWDLDGEWFYFINSHNTMINRYNIRTGESTADVWFDLEVRDVTPESRTHLMEQSSNMTRRFPDLRKTMEAVTVFPLFQEFMVHDNSLYLVIFNVAGSESTEIIRIKEASGKVHYMDIPLMLWKVQAGNEMLYGIENSEDGDSVIRIVHFEKY